ncbi:MAG: magnesium transporter CorA family protein [Planctomycetes bacterium]|jgi:magnesium transporter|nr:magnesium transporter CorA family protein [Planctomycetota bacterium]
MSNYRQLAKNVQQVTIDNPKTPNDKLVWINIIDAGKKEIEFLRKNYDFQLAHLQASSAKATAQRPQLAQGKNYLFMILHFPVLNSGKIIPGEIDFFVGPGFLITIHNNCLGAIGEFFNLCKKESGATMAFTYESSSVLLYELLEKLILNCYSMLDNNSVRINAVEQLIFAQEQKKAVAQILLLRLNIINFRKIMQNHKNIMKKLIDQKSRFVPAEVIKKFYARLVEHTKRIWENLENQKETVEVINGTNESLLNYRISDIMKTLTIFSVIVFPLTLFAAIFGMNAMDGMPFVDTPNGFWVIIAIMLTGCLGMLLYFEKKKWL